MTPDSDSTSPASKGSNTPRPETQALPALEPEKKPEKKLETPILVAIISAVVTLITAILGNPMFVNLVNKTDTPAPTSAIELVISQNSLLPNNPPGGELFLGKFTPLESGTNTIEYTSTPPGGNPSYTPPLLESTFTSTAPPPQEPDPPTPAAPTTLQCIATDFWFLYPTTVNSEIDNGCLNLAEWGFSAEQGRLSLVHSPVQDQQSGIYMPIAGDVDIRFIVQMDEFRTRKNKAGFLNFGIVQNDPISIYTGGYLSYQQPAPGTDSPIRVLISGSHQATQKISVLEAEFQHEVLLSTRDDLMTVYLNGEQAGDPVSLPHADRVFWIGYVLPSKSVLEVMITNLTIQTY
jgi:hypothetical protein